MRALSVLLMLWTATFLPAPASAAGQPDESVLDVQLQRAQALEQAGDFEQALELYRHLDRAYPQNEQVELGIRANLERLGRYEELVPLLEQALGGQPGSLDLRIALGRALHKTGQRDAAQAQWRAAIDQTPDQPAAYLAVAYELSRNKEADEAIALYQEGRTRLGDPRLFAIELARLYTWQMGYADAARELLAHLDTHPQEHTLVESYLFEFPKDPKVVEAVTQVLAGAVHADTTHTGNRRLLGDYFLAVGRPEDALGEYLWIAVYEDRHDRARSGGGKALFEFAARCQQDNQVRAARLGYESLLEAFPKSAYAPRAMLGIGQSLEHLGKHDEAITRYRLLQQSFPATAEVHEAAYRIGRIQLEVRHDPEAALAVFRDLAESAAQRRDTDLKYRALLGVGDALLAKGALQEARETYRTVAPVKDRLDYAEVASFRLAELDYYAGAWDQALKGWETVTLRFPEGSLVNDALRMIMRLEAVPEASLTHLAEAEYLQQQGHLDQAAAAVESWLTDPAHRPQDEPLALLLLSVLNEARGDYEGALRACRRIIAQHGLSPLCPEVQQRIGRIYQQRIGDVHAAIAQYELVLTNYPGSLLTDEVRRTVRDLMAQGE